MFVPKQYNLKEKKKKNSPSRLILNFLAAILFLLINAQAYNAKLWKEVSKVAYAQLIVNALIAIIFILRIFRSKSENDIVDRAGGAVLEAVDLLVIAPSSVLAIFWALALLGFI